MTDSRPPELAESAVFAAEVARFRAVLTTGRSPVFLQLFDLLVERSRDDRAPKEVEIALAIFGRDPGQSDAPDSVVRVTMYRLRKRLDEFYAGHAGLRLDIPKGEYRIVLVPATAPVAAPPPPPSRPEERPRGRARWWAALAGVAAVNALGWGYVASTTRGGAGGGPRTGYWQVLAPGAAPLLVIGDSYMLAETENQKDIKQIILEPGIRSRGDFGAYLTTHPDAFYRLYDLDLHYTPVGTAAATWSLLPLLADASGGAAGVRARLIASSRLTAQALDGNDIVYVGPLAALGILAAPLFQASGFSLDASGTRLTDRTSRRSYAIRSAPNDSQESRDDYGYLASVAGPSGRHILVISGLGDGGVRAMADLVRDPAQIQQLTRRIGSAAPFEALFQIRSAGAVRLARTLVVLRPLRGGTTATATPKRDAP